MNQIYKSDTVRQRDGIITQNKENTDRQRLSVSAFFVFDSLLKMGEYMNIFDILGPVMVGPSSSHTAGAVRIGYVAMHLLKEPLQSVIVTFSGSFAATGTGHGTDRAIIAGLLRMKPDDIRIPDSFLYAEKYGLSYRFETAAITGAHPNTVILLMEGKNGRSLKVQAASLGGGLIMINRLDDIEVNFTAQKPALIVHNLDKPGHVAQVTLALAENKINIAAMQLHRSKRGGYAVMVLETDQEIPETVLKKLEVLEGIIKITYINVTV